MAFATEAKEGYKSGRASGCLKRKDDKMKIVPHERYVLTLRHEYVDEDGERHSFEDPITVEHVTLPGGRWGMIPPTSIVINEMLDQMKRYILQMTEAEVGTEGRQRGIKHG